MPSPGVAHHLHADVAPLPLAAADASHKPAYVADHSRLRCSAWPNAMSRLAIKYGLWGEGTAAVGM